ncbi:alpha/beta fold hydrolase [Aestuariibacter salexigens]|uniref:alpha/beta fold hydrolase n=1 Tax=Aestuariibacter salexigens TaxID=226010 RepID=UPI00040C9200|nr:alpha/beta hydrolase [Aestuariibacter salexigens]
MLVKTLKIVVTVMVALIAALLIYIQTQKMPDKPVSELTERWAASPSQFIEVAGMQVHVRDEGPKQDDTPIILIHGTGASLHTWDGWTDELKNQHRVIRFDLPAFGLTGPAPDNNYTIERYAQVVIALMDALNIERATLAGNSLGGYIAWATAVMFDTRVNKLVLVDASGYPYDAESVPLAFKLSQNKLAKSVLTNFLPRWLIARSVKNVYGDPDKVSDDVIERYYELTQREGNRAALAQRFVQTKPGPLADKVPTITQPTLIIWGAKDKLIPLKFAHRFAEEIPNNELVIFNELGHVPHEEDPQRTVVPVQAFLQ